MATATAPDLVQFSAYLIGCDAIPAKGNYEEQVEFKFIRSAHFSAANTTFDASQLYQVDPLRPNFSYRVPKSNTSLLKLLTSFPVNRLLSISALTWPTSFENKPAQRYTMLSYIADEPKK